MATVREGVGRGARGQETGDGERWGVERGEKTLKEEGHA